MKAGDRVRILSTPPPVPARFAGRLGTVVRTENHSDITLVVVRADRRSGDTRFESVCREWGYLPERLDTKFRGRPGRKPKGVPSAG